MKVVKLDLTVTETLIVNSGLDAIINDRERLNIDKVLAEKLKRKIVNIAKENNIELGGE